MLGICLRIPYAQAETIPLETFAATDAISDAAISPDGRYIAEVLMLANRRYVAVLDRQGDHPTKVAVLKDVENQFDIRWCRWASNTRLLCSYRGVVNDAGTLVELTRMVAVDPDGKNQLVLFSKSDTAGGQFQDRVIDWNPGKPDTVLIEAEESLLDAQTRVDILAGAEVAGNDLSSGAYPAVFELNVKTGKLHEVLHSFNPVLNILTDFHGNPRIGWGYAVQTATIQYFARPTGGRGWQHLAKYEAFSAASAKYLKPVAINSEQPDQAYAIGDYNGRDALWSVDLSDQNAPQLLYSNSKVDVSEPVLLKDGHMIGVLYDTERPHVYYTDPVFAAVMNIVDASLPDTFNRVIDVSADRTQVLILATSDADPGSYYLFDTKNRALLTLGQGNPGLTPSGLGRMLSISYPARDGTVIPGYLTKPPGGGDSNLPLIVMPHGGPIARDSWEYFFLQQFLVNRGYAVLQMNFRGSDGYGQKWYSDAHQDWGGVTYNDIIDGAKWAIKSGIADPHRVAIVGWSFGGYAALLGAVRDSDTFRCAISIAGVSDLTLLEREEDEYINGAFARQQIGTETAKLKADSPRRHADGVRIPLLLVHGDKDPQVYYEQSKAMASALSAANKPYQFITLKDADHQIDKTADRVTLLTAVEQFLKTNMAAGTP